MAAAPIATRSDVQLGLSTSTPGFAVVDIETTGLSPHTDRIVEIAVLTTDARGRVLREWSTRINPGRPVGATHVHGLKDADVREAPTFGTVAETVASLVTMRVIVAHNAVFDAGFLRAEFERAGWSWPQMPTLCTLEASHYYLPFLERRRLADCCYACGVGLFDEHSALGDARAVAQLLSVFLYPTWGRPPLPEHLGLLDQATHGPAPVPIAIPCPPHEEALAGRGRRARATEAHPFRTLGQLLDDFAIGELDAPTDAAHNPAALAYLELLAEALEDGELSSGELHALGDIAALYQLSLADVMTLHTQFIRALADKAVEDQFVSKAERTDLIAAAALLELDSAIAEDCLQQAESARQDTLSAQCRPLPVGWSHAEPLHLGDRIAFTGGDPAQRAELERASTQAGLRLTGSVSRKTAALITDGAFHGNKAEAADHLGTRLIHPDDLLYLLDHIQPATPAPTRPAKPQRANTAPAALGITLPPLDPVAVRAWARDQGMITGTRGRISRDIVEAYLHATPAADDPGY